jgi:REP element-mobilizing transposase RayT
MSRPLRIDYPGAFYHITSRGHERKAVFKSHRSDPKNIHTDKAEQQSKKGCQNHREKGLFVKCVGLTLFTI